MNERHIDIIGAAGNTVNIDINCPSCKKHFMAKTEVMQMDVANLSGEKLASLQQAIEALKGKLGGDIEIDAQFLSGRIEETSKEDSIQDTEIQALQKSLSQK